MSPELSSSCHTLFSKPHIKKNLVLVSVDEVHCVLDWLLILTQNIAIIIQISFYRGKDFRTAFRKLGGLRALTNAPFMALTATASEEMQASIEELLNMAEPVVISRSIDRPNVYYSASTIKSLDVS